ncbi:MAG: toluene tolerance protein, partial [Gammaproteobacteria bacterium]|nr:toluene tolerance protein [Gammaproteobacteria bacterium]
MWLLPRSTPISAAEFRQLRAGARLLERDYRGEKVLLTPDNHIIKLFYPRRRFTSARIYPYAHRFCNNARQLREKGIITVHCEQLRYDRTNRRHLITYPLLPGTTLRSTLNEVNNREDYLEKLASYLATLHAKGILFRSVHLGNILVLENGDYGLIDVADMTIQPGPLGLRKRARNFRHLLHDREDREQLDSYGYGRFLEHYEAAAGISDSRRTRLRSYLKRY